MTAAAAGPQRIDGNDVREKLAAGAFTLNDHDVTDAARQLGCTPATGPRGAVSMLGAQIEHAATMSATCARDALAIRLRVSAGGDVALAGVGSGGSGGRVDWKVC
ncbi:hypothetical protein VX037_22925 [Gordonia sp. Z-3]|uniref:Uncharacterized protein n=1 Tax=Gordonia tangerina TaxID=2911060 RepID=A0ABS9DHF5_9ACTN|nr:MULTISPECIES: hypothetical protein [Gordonia]MCF3938533.1 hypothetical protein [Gordonia tangerina]MED5803884.1 hypothetical protein [Gordonia sp. Z-3]